MGKKYTADSINIGEHSLDATMMASLNTVAANHSNYLTTMPSHNHDDRYYTESESDSRFVNVTGDTMTGNLTVPQIITTHNGAGTNVKIGDDAWIGDTNVANTIQITGSQDSTKGYIVFGSSDNMSLGRSGTGNLTYGGYSVFHENYHPNADKWTTARTLSLSGDVTGSVSWDGSGNATMTTTVTNNSHTHDDRYYTESEADSRFVNVTGDTVTGNLLISGNVGIGTTSPSHKLHVHSDVDNNYIARFEGSTNNGSGVWTGIGIGGESNNTKSAIIFEDIGTSYSRGKLHLAVNNDANQNDATKNDAKLTIIPDGNVGIGTTDPSEKLDVHGSIALQNDLYYSGAYNWMFNQDGGNGRLAISYYGSEKVSIKDNGNVGIGTTSPGTKLHVNGGIVTVNDGNGATYYEGVKINSYSTNGYSIIGREGLTLSTASANKDIILSPTGNVGIGTASPSYKLHVAGKSYLSGGIQMNSGDEIDFGNSNQYITGVNDTSLTLATGGSATLTATHAGNVGIGTTSPSTSLHIQSSTTNAFKLNNSSNSSVNIVSDNTYLGLYPANYIVLGRTTLGYADLMFLEDKKIKWNETDGSWYDVLYSSGTDNLIKFGSVTSVSTGGNTAFYHNGSEKMRLTSTGLGIGTTTPDAKLDILTSPGNSWVNLVNGDESAFRLKIYNNGTNNGSNAYAFKHGLYYNSTENAAITFYRGSSSTGGFLTFTTNSGSERMRINSLGNIGIGTTSPSEKLAVNGNIETTSPQGKIGFNVGDAYGNYPHYGLGKSAGANPVNLSGYYGLTFGTDGSERIRITDTGKVGISTTSPDAKLQVVRSAALPNATNNNSGNWIESSAFRITSGNNGLSIGVDNVVNSRTSWIQSGHESTVYASSLSDSELLLQPLGGNVGIGTTSPAYKLDVESSGTAANIKSIQSTGLIVQGGGNSTDIAQFKDSTGNTEVVIDTNGNIGIGATTPQKTLDVDGEVLLRDHLFVGGYGENASTNSIEIGRNRTGNGICFFDMTTDNTTYTDYGFRLIRYSGVNANTELIHRGTGDFKIKGQDASTMMFFTNNSVRMRIASNGNIGVGTTSPQAKLHVANGALRTWAPISGTSAIFESTVNSRNFITIAAANEAEIWFGDASVQNRARIRYEMAGANMEFWTNGGQKMVIDSTGNVGIGTTSPSAKLHVNGKVAANTDGFEIKTGSYGNLGLKSYYGSLYTTTNMYIGGVNGISYKSVSASAFNVNSDYRLKSNLAPLEDAVDRVKKLPVHRFNWKDRENEDKVDGFLAHEVSSVVPEAVTGEKDAVREDGTLEYQQIDQSKIVPLLTAALQEAIEKIEQLENRIQTLENN